MQPTTPVGSLILAARKGDEGAFEQLIDECRSYVHLLARLSIGKRLRQHMDESDAAQEVLVRVHAAFAEFRGTTEPEFLGWLRTILGRTLADAARRAGARRQANPQIFSLEMSVDESSLVS